MSRLRPYWRITVVAYLSMLAVTGLALIIPQFIRFIVDEGIEKGNLALLTRSVSRSWG